MVGNDAVILFAESFEFGQKMAQRFVHDVLLALNLNGLGDLPIDSPRKIRVAAARPRTPAITWKGRTGAALQAFAG
jgi:hypothetical protein